MVGHLSARCTYCQVISRVKQGSFLKFEKIRDVDDMMAHGIACPRRRLHQLQLSDPPEKVRCNKEGECAGPLGCQWGDILALELLPALPNEVEQYIAHWLQSALDAGEQYTQQHSFRSLAQHIPQLVATAWLRCWSTNSTAREGPTVREMCAMHELLPAPENRPIASVFDRSLLQAIAVIPDDTLPNALYDVLVGTIKDATPKFLNALLPIQLFSLIL